MLARRLGDKLARVKVGWVEAVLSSRTAALWRLGIGFGLFVVTGGGGDSGSEPELEAVGGEDPGDAIAGAGVDIADAGEALAAETADPEENPFANAAGQYRLSEGSARAQFEPSDAIHRVEAETRADRALDDEAGSTMIALIR